MKNKVYLGILVLIILVFSVLTFLLSAHVSLFSRYNVITKETDYLKFKVEKKTVEKLSEGKLNYMDKIFFDLDEGFEVVYESNTTINYMKDNDVVSITYIPSSLDSNMLKYIAEYSNVDTVRLDKIIEENNFKSSIDLDYWLFENGVKDLNIFASTKEIEKQVLLFSRFDVKNITDKQNNYVLSGSIEGIWNTLDGRANSIELKNNGDYFYIGFSDAFDMDEIADFITTIHFE